MTAAGLVLVEQMDRVARVTLNRPDKRNALNADLLAEFSNRMRELDRQDEVSVIVVRGAGPSFCSGYDISAHGDPQRAERRASGDVMADWLAMKKHSQRWLDLWHLTTPTIAQVHGHCIAGGAELALMCDLVVATDDARIGHPVVRNLGVPATNAYPYLVGLRRAKELVLTGDLLTGTEAAAIGLINRAVAPDDLESVVLELAARIARTPKVLLAMNKQTVNDAYRVMGFDVGVQLGAQMDALAHATPEVKAAGVGGY